MCSVGAGLFVQKAVSVWFPTPGTSPLQVSSSPWPAPFILALKHAECRAMSFNPTVVKNQEPACLMALSTVLGAGVGNIDV